MRVEVHFLPYSMDRTTLCTFDASKVGPGPSNPLMTAYSASMWNIAEPAPMLYIDVASIREHALVLPLPVSTDRIPSIAAMTARKETGRRLRPAVPCHGIVLGAYFGADYFDAGPLLKRLDRATRYYRGGSKRWAWIMQCLYAGTEAR